MFCERKTLHENCDQNFNSNEFHFVEKLDGYLSCDLFQMTNQMIN